MIISHYDHHQPQPPYDPTKTVHDTSTIDPKCHQPTKCPSQLRHNLINQPNILWPPSVTLTKKEKKHSRRVGDMQNPKSP